VDRFSPRLPSPVPVETIYRLAQGFRSAYGGFVFDSGCPMRPGTLPLLTSVRYLQ
jgi:hypothetical protein